jgi:hypothetical protein
MTAALEDLNDALPRLDWAEVGERRQGAIGLTPLDAAPMPRPGCGSALRCSAR